MKLRKFNKTNILNKLKNRNNKRLKITTIVCSICILVVAIIYFSFARFESNSSYSLINGRVGETGDARIIAYNYDGETHSEPPKKYSGYVIDTVECTNANGYWNSKDWSLKITNITGKAKCTLTFKTGTYEPSTLVEYIQYLAKDGNLSSTDEIGTTSLAYDGTKDNNLRYIGSSPNNYIYYNCSDYNNQNDSTCEKWRIIGVMNNIETDESGTTESLVKIVRNESIGRYVWDTSAASVNNGGGISQWGESTYEDGSTYYGADLMKLLNPGYETNQDLDSSGNTITVNNSLYYNAGSGNCYNNTSNKYTSCDFTSTGIKNAITKNFIQDIKWPCGAASQYGTTSNGGKASGMYKDEKSNVPYIKGDCDSINCTDTVVRKAQWNGKIALINASDYGFAIGGSNRSMCLQRGLNAYTACYNDNWLFIPTYFLTTLANATRWDQISNIFTSDTNTNYLGTSNNGPAANNANYFPTLHLKSNVNIQVNNASDYGSETNPFKIIVE